MQTTQDKNGRTSAHKTSTPESKLLEIRREFDVRVERLFEAFRTPEALKAWWWPNGLYAKRIDMEFRRGGEYFIDMQGWEHPGGMIGRFEEIDEGRRIVMSDQFADANGRAISAEQAGMRGVWPEKLYITFEFSSLDEGRSALQLSQEGVPNEMQGDCIQGWTESFDKLESYLGGTRH